MKIEIAGHSGCKIELRSEGNKSVLRKYSSGENYNQRLKSQQEKQALFVEKYGIEHVSAPQILSDGEKDDLYYFEMPFLPSKSFVNYFEHADKHGVKNFITVIRNFFDVLIENNSYEQVPLSKLTDKYYQVKRTCSQNYFLRENTMELFYHTDNIMDHLRNTMNHFNIPTGFCHGDLTLSNILFGSNGNRIDLIDFLDSFIESPLMDMVKLRQDTEYFWSFMLYKKPFDQTKLKIILTYIDESIDRYFRKFEFYNDHYQVFQLVNFLRILQYVNNRDIEDFLKKTISKIIKNIDYELNYSSSGSFDQVS